MLYNYVRAERQTQSDVLSPLFKHYLFEETILGLFLLILLLGLTNLILRQCNCNLQSLHHVLASCSFFIPFSLSCALLLSFDLVSDGIPLALLFHIPSTTNFCHKFLDFLFRTKCFRHCCRYLFKRLFHSCVMHSGSCLITLLQQFKPYINEMKISTQFF